MLGSLCLEKACNEGPMFWYNMKQGRKLAMLGILRDADGRSDVGMAVDMLIANLQRVQTRIRW